MDEQDRVLLRRVHADSLEAATADVLELTIGDLTAPAGEPACDGCVTATIPITGPNHASLVVTCTEEFARALAAAMFDMASGDLSPEEVHDALGELTNMIGGSVKTLLDGEWRLGLPSVQPGTGDGLALPAPEPQCTTRVDHCGHQVGLHFYSAEVHGRADAARKDQQ
jgi:chemotaxis protein CheX